MPAIPHVSALKSWLRCEEAHAGLPRRNAGFNEEVHSTM
jgi:hypothetical protein